VCAVQVRLTIQGLGNGERLRIAMTQISSSATFFYKRVFPVFWFGILISIVFSAVASGAYKDDAMVFVGSALMLTIGFFVMKMLVWDLADKVMDGGKFLLVAQHGEEVRVPLSDIMHVSVSKMTNPKRITLRLIKAGRWGNEIVFMPPVATSPFGMDRIVENLMVRVDQARSTRAQ
jgi:hypothetical protein